MYLRVLQPHGPYRVGQKILAGPGQNMGTGVAKILLQRGIVQLLPGEPVETEPRPPRKTKRAG